ncbi:MAG: DUF3467 domain-containing protein [Burkholderiales bacterium]|nr:DUF3467 domain-containing protein [Burkholderiales bacterium]
MAENKDEPGKDKPAPEPNRVHWDTSQLKSSYCNIANATSTREEVIVNFGINENWERPRTELEVQLLHRIILSPYAAKRLQELLTKLIKEYEARYGVLK